MLSFEWTSRIETVGRKLAGGKGLREERDSNELWKSVEKSPPILRGASNLLVALDPLHTSGRCFGQLTFPDTDHTIA